MSGSSEFRQYAEEALQWVNESKTEEEKRTLTDLACMWAQAALQSERIFGGNASAPDGLEDLAKVSTAGVATELSAWSASARPRQTAW